MDLFRQPQSEPENILPKDGVVHYYGALIPAPDADCYFQKLLHSIAWQNDKVIIYGKEIVTKRKIAWYASSAFEYTYSNITKRALPWTEVLLELKSLIEHRTGEVFNSCLLNLYHNGSEGMTWHSDAEKDLKKFGAIGSISLGAERKFAFKHKKTKETVSLALQHGDLLVMKGNTQYHWMHALPTTKKVHEARINLTFRSIVDKP